MHLENQDSKFKLQDEIIFFVFSFYKKIVYSEHQLLHYDKVVFFSNSYCILVKFLISFNH